MHVYSTAKSSNHLYYCVDEKFAKGTQEDLRKTVYDASESIYWDRTTETAISRSVDLRDLLNWFKIETTEALEPFCQKQSFEEYLVLRDQIKKILKTYAPCGIEVNKQVPFDYIPKGITKEYLLCKNAILKETYSSLAEKYDIKAFYDYFRYQLNLDAISLLNKAVLTVDGEKEVKLLYAQNFRFKPARGSYNLFTCSAKERASLIAQNENSFIFCADFKQFEFRSFLLTSGFDIDFSDQQIYSTFGKICGLKEETAKQDIIAYLYGQRNDKIQKHIDKDSILSKVEGGIYWHNEKPVLVVEDHEEHKKVHTIVQTISQYYIINKINKVLDLLKNKESQMLYPHHDNLVFSIDKSETALIEQIYNILSDSVYYVKCYVGKDFYNLKEINVCKKIT